MGGPVRGPGAATVGSSRLPPAAHGDGDRFLGRETWNESGTQKTLITYYIGDYQAVLDPSLGGITSEATRCPFAMLWNIFSVQTIQGKWIDDEPGKCARN